MDIASLVAFRVFFGLAMFAAVVRFFAHGWIREYYLVPRHFFHYWGFEWVRPWPGYGMYVHYGLMGLFALFIALGYFYRASAASFFVLFTYAHLADKTNYLNHYYLVSCLALIMVFLPLDRAASIRVWRRPGDTWSTVPGWCLWLVRFQVGCVYVFGGIAKLKTDWLVYAEPLTIWLGANTDVPVVGRFFHEKWAAYAFSWAGAAFDLSVVFWLSRRRSRRFAYAALVGFHVMTARLFQLGMFPWIMIGAALIFFDPSWPRRLLASVRLLPREAKISPAAHAPMPRWGHWAVGVYVAWQTLVPLRHWLYSGNVLWTEQGFRFAWNVMLIEKNGAVDVTVRDPHKGTTSVIDPADYLTRYQIKMMSTQPDMILEFAHIVADDYRRRGVRDVEVRVDALVALNGRRAQHLIDSNVDLAKEREGLHPKQWILPLAAEPPEL